MGCQNFSSSLCIVAAAGRKHVQHFGIFQGRCLVLDIAVHENAVATAQNKRLVRADELDAPGDDIDKLLMPELVATVRKPPLNSQAVRTTCNCFGINWEKTSQTGISRLS